MSKLRGFEKVSTFTDINLPVRATKNAAGYDFEAANDILIPSVWTEGVYASLKTAYDKAEFSYSKEISDKIKPVLVPTGIKAYMGENEFLQLCNRSSNPLKNFLVLSNGLGIIDSDYFNNPDNEGHIMFQFTNYGLSDFLIKKGDRIGQGVFLPFLKTDDDNSTASREGGFGSSGK